MNMSWNSWCARCFGVLKLGVVLTASCYAQSEQAVPRIGIIAPLSGGVATWGKSIQAAIELANQESANSADIFFEDEETCIPTKTLSAFQSLVINKKVDVLVASCLEGAQVVAPLAKRKGIPLFISGRSSREFQKNHPNALSWLSLLDYEGKAIAELIRERKWTRGAAMVWSGYFGVQFSEGMRVAIEEGGIPFALEVQECAQGANPVGAEVQRLVRSNPQVIFLMLSEPGAAFVMRQLRLLHYRGDVVLQSSMLQTYDRNVREQFVGALQQKFPVNEGRVAEMRRQLHDRYHQEVADDFVFSYDGFKALLQALRDCGGTEKEPHDECLNHMLRNEVWREGASGPFRFMKDGSTERPMAFKVITADGFLPSLFLRDRAEATSSGEFSITHMTRARG